MPFPLVHEKSSVYFTCSRYESFLIATVRRYNINRNGDQMPTREGMIFTKRDDDDLKELIQSMVLIAEAAH